MSKYAFGIDLGTSTSEVSYISNNRPNPIPDPNTKTPIVPSVVSLSRRGETLVGEDALSGLPESIIREAKRKMGEEYKFILGSIELSPEEVSALVLKRVKSNAEQALGVTLEKAVITVPAYFDDLPRRATERAARLAGIEPLRLINEPVAAALAYGIDRMNDSGMLLVFDFGGGTLDVTIIDMQEGVLEVKATDGDKELGGKDMDELLMHFIVQKSKLQMPPERSKSWESLKSHAERAKKSLTSSTTVDVFIPSFATGESELADLDIEVTRQEFETLIAPLVNRSVEKVEGCLKKAGVKKDSIERLLLVGGTCYIPFVRESVESFVGQKSESGVDPDLAVSLGAAISAGLKTGELDSETSPIVQDVSTHRMGIRARSDIGGQSKLVFVELMDMNAHVPYFHSEPFQLLTTEQDTVEIEVFQDAGNAFYIHEAIPTGARGEIRDIPPATTSEPRALDVELRYDESHIIRVTAKVVGIDRTLTLVLHADQIGDDPLKAMSSESIVSDLWEKSPLATKNASLIKRAEAVLQDKPDNGEHIEAALFDLKTAVASNSPDSAQSARERLVDLLSE